MNTTRPTAALPNSEGKSLSARAMNRLRMRRNTIPTNIPASTLLMKATIPPVVIIDDCHIRRPGLRKPMLYSAPWTSSWVERIKYLRSCGAVSM
ncbi:MAG: hypothetical protein DLM69_03020 [Candidatus Chloroheliales bacterium]|nr:MAG: hypothetical protein DLM69_03020 [Chloroflexota bacterium]